MNASIENLIQQEITSYQNLCRDTGYLTPPWILPEPSCALLKKLCALIAPQPSAFEFGSGRSTIALRSVCASVTSVEDSVEWLEKTEMLDGQIPKRPSDTTAVIPLSACRLGIIPFKSFHLKPHTDLFQRLQTADIILVDSPPNPATREHALFLALQQAKPGTVIILDDLEVRATMRFATRLAHHNEGCLDFLHVPIDHGLGIFQKTAVSKLTYCPTLREVVGTWQRS
jgi:hypothetical protein